MTRNEPRVLFFCHSAWSQRGGIQSFNKRVIEGLDTLSIKHVSMVLHDNETGSPIAQGMRSSHVKSAFLLLRGILRSNVLLLGHINYLPTAMVFKLLRPSGRVALFAHGVEVWGSAKYRAPRFYEAWLLSKFVDKIAIVSDYSKNLMSASFSVPEYKFIHFPNAVQMNEEHDSGTKSGSMVLTVSRLARSEPEKNVDKIIRAFALVLSQIPEAKLVVVGDGELKNELEDVSQVLGIHKSVEFLGFVDQLTLDRAYSQASVFALPSSKEGFGIVYLEAWLRGTPVIASVYGAGGEVVSHGVDGFVVDPSDLTGLAQAMVDLLNDATRRRAFAQRGRAKVLKKYTTSAFNERLAKLTSMGPPSG